MLHLASSVDSLPTSSSFLIRQDFWATPALPRHEQSQNSPYLSSPCPSPSSMETASSSTCYFSNTSPNTGATTSPDTSPPPSIVFAPATPMLGSVIVQQVTYDVADMARTMATSLDHGAHGTEATLDPCLLSRYVNSFQHNATETLILFAMCSFCSILRCTLCKIPVEHSPLPPQTCLSLCSWSRTPSLSSPSLGMRCLVGGGVSNECAHFSNSSLIDIPQRPIVVPSNIKLRSVRTVWAVQTCVRRWLSVVARRRS
jgi:hypothetical protein